MHYLLILVMLNAPAMQTDTIVVNLPPDRSCISAQHDAAAAYEKEIKGSRVLRASCTPVEEGDTLVTHEASR